jgi:voltage-dependent potassium channel beta subunit
MTDKPTAEMGYRRLGGSGLQVSELSFGAWVTFGQQIGSDTARDLMRTAYANGINFFDNAEAYAGGRAEEVMGEILQKEGWPRDTWLVSSKVFWGGDKPNQSGLSRKHVMEACEAALRRLRVDYLDLYFCHRPDPQTPIEETVLAMGTLIQQGKVLYWGTSEWSAREIEEAKAVAREYRVPGPTMEQPQYNLLHRERVETEYAPLYAARGGYGTTIWSPLASGLLTGKYNDGIPEDSRMTLENLPWLRAATVDNKELWMKRRGQLQTLAGIAAEVGCSMPQLSLAWCLRNPHVSTVILGASRVSQLEENLGCLAVVERIDDVLKQRIEEAVA